MRAPESAAQRSAVEGAPIPPRLVEVTAPARLHMGFVDPAGLTGRRFGGVGLALDRPLTRVRLQRAEGLQVRGAEAARAERYAARLLEHFDATGGVRIEVDEAMPAHAGLGSGTQLALALGAALACWYRRRAGAAEVAALLDRGGRSAIGIGAFEHGGFLVDGGRGAANGPPPLIARCEVPPDWRVVLVYDTSHRGLSGATEREAFRALARRSPPGGETLASLVLLGMLPAVVEGDLVAFGAAVTELQERIGDHFAPVQGGRFASPAVTEVLGWLRRRGVDGVGQSSWGPTGFGLCDSEARARALIESLESRRRPGSALRFELARPRNEPAAIRRVDGDDQTQH